jgi:hypothetical protein
MVLAQELPAHGQDFAMESLGFKRVALETQARHKIVQSRAALNLPWIGGIQAE